jgi:chromosome segregation protein
VLNLHLKKVEIQGFKSFADKTEIEFKEGITAIVGPNGSGKSNVSDAIRWVLGEQSVKTLRGSKMEDIIFSGTSKRKPLGYSEVTITFDNKNGSIPIDYTEVAVTRRMFRSGESEYYINKNSCRLKDVRELFMDTGVGKDGYSIIGQGRIDEILSTRPEDRRHIFEEAAGIVKYKTRKEEAERKLDKTEANLVRIKDLIHELSSQSESLEDQSTKATSFIKLSNRLKELEVNLFIREIERLNLQSKEISKERETLENEIKTMIDEKINIEEKYNFLKSTTEEMDSKIEKIQKEKYQIINQLEKNKNDITLLEEKEKYYQKDLERLEDERKTLDINLNNLEKVKADLIIEKDNTLINFNSLVESYKDKDIELNKIITDLGGKEKTIEGEKNNIINIYNLISDKKSELNSINSFYENMEKRISQLTKEIDLINKDKDLVINKSKLLEAEEDRTKEKLVSLETKLRELNNQDLENRNNYDLLNKKINENQLNVQGLVSSYNLLKNMEDGYEGYYKSVKGLLLASKKDSSVNEGLIGVIADLIKVEEKYERAIDISLGSNIQNIVTENERDAKRIIDYLKKHNLGRITFLPLNTIKGNTLNINPSDREKFKVLGLGSELVTFKEEYKNIFQYLLGRTVIVENLDYGTKLANKYNYSFRIVTLEGDLINPGGSMTGGSFGKSTGTLINRKYRIEKLEKEIKELSNIQKRLEEERHLQKSILDNTKEEITELDSLIKNTNYEIIRIENEKNKCYSEISRLEDTVLKYSNEICSLEEEVLELDGKKEDINYRLSELEKSSLSIKEKVKNLVGNLDEEKNSKEELSKIVTNLKIDINLTENKLESLEEKLSENDKEIHTSGQMIIEKEELILETKNNIEELIESKGLIIEVINKLVVLEERITKELDDLKKDKENFMENFYLEQGRLKEINDKINEIERLKNTLEVKLTRFSVQLENYHKKLLDDYELTYEEAIEYKMDIDNIQDATVEVKKLKGEIKELGSVNLGSIEEFKKLKERLEFITKQQKDLLTAKENLKEVIKDMEDKMKVQFINSFNEIKEKFTEVFTILFDGGKANLVLEDEENILNSGIEINAQPPGKKLQSLTLLSGGEKSLTAVALLFAILQTKPAPFCILDEIDAALDEANISRYTNYLKTFCYNTQFIMITHRKTTMEMSDILYGVTMEEEGVSKLISIKLKDNIDEIAS